MIGSRVMFGFIPLFLFLVITISTAPIPDNQLVPTKLVEQTTNETITTTESVNYEDDSSEPDEILDEQDIESTTIEVKEVITIELKEETTIKPEETTNEPKEETTIKPKEETTTKPKEETTIEVKVETTIIPDVVTKDRLFTDTTEISFHLDEILKIADRLFSEPQVELPSTPTTESPESADDDE